MPSCGVIWGLYRGNGKGNGNYRDYRGYIGIKGYVLGKNLGIRV